ncbi:diacylglycerol kinase family protein [Rossellomorea vietnamensis]|uniref:Diacylglycerol kinase family protein n=1 Tax=Rossellomorea vietnamensis TaxID=218284 RepID=A0A5D4KF27_9BACI|nr:diacylglycerol kinase family protein [Rossellomorea vietnamensis]TYR75479.1 diacylglycerol kinase family protein [Rossellomorea vietnamensis]
MDTDFKDKPSRRRKFLRSFKFAFKGIKLVFAEELNFRVHFTVSIAVVAAGFVLSISLPEWIAIILLITGMFALEMLNTAIERTVDLVTKEYHPLAGQAKDIAAGAVLCYALGAVVVGIMIFLPKLWEIVK